MTTTTITTMNAIIQNSLLIHTEAWRTLLPDVEKWAESVIREALLHVGFKPETEVEISLVLADDAFIQPLNAEYRGKDKPTNVLSFPAEEIQPEIIPLLQERSETVMLGDIIVALETVQREAAEEGKSFRDHTAHMLVHGTLHLLGYDHEEAAEAEEMEALEVRILERLGVGNPY